MASPFITPGYRYATQKYPGDGVTTDFEFNFVGEYISKDHVTAYEMVDLTKIETAIPSSDFTVVGTNQFRLLNGRTIPVGHTLVIRRDTPKGLPLVDYNDGAILNEYNMDMSNEQNVFSVAELIDLFWDMIDIFRDLNQQILDALDDFDSIRQEWNLFRIEINNRISSLELAFANFQISVQNQLNQFGDTLDSYLDMILQALDAASNALTVANQALDAANEATLTADEAYDLAQQAYDKAMESIDIANQALQAAADAAASALAAQQAAEAAQAALEAILAMVRSRTIEVVATGAFTNSSEEIFRLPMSEPIVCVWPSNTPGNAPFRCTLHSAPASQFDVTVYKNDEQLGFIRFAPGSLNGSWTNTTGSNTVSFSVNDIFGLQIPSGDSTAGGLGCSITGITVTL